MKGNEKKAGEGASAWLRGALLGLVVSLVSGILFVIIAAFIIYLTPDPDKYTTVGSLAALYLSSVAGGIFAGRTGEKSAAAALVSGLLLTAVILIISAFDTEAGSSFGPLTGSLLYAAVPLASVAGAFLGAGMGSKSERKPKFKKRKH